MATPLAPVMARINSRPSAPILHTCDRHLCQNNRGKHGIALGVCQPESKLFVQVGPQGEPHQAGDIDAEGETESQGKDLEV